MYYNRTSDGKKLNVHKAILATRSGYFSLEVMRLMAAVLKANKTSKASKTNLEISVNVTQEVMRKILDFIYTDEIQFAGLTDDILFQLTMAADQFELERLKAICQNHVCSTLSLKNIISTFIFRKLNNVCQMC